MSVLSDYEISELITEANLIEGAASERVFACSYEFRPGMVISTGREVDDRCAKDWTGGNGDFRDVHAIQPGELVWIRTLEKVSMPHDLCGFWWQTNRLSRQGLMLVNMSMVEPGYRGPLACLFVNFGNKPVTIDPDTVVAKLVFSRLSRSVQERFSENRSEISYDRSIVRAAMGAPVTFLDVGNIEFGLDRRRAEAIQEMEAELRRMKNELADEAAKLKTEGRDQFADDSKSLIRKVLGAAAIGFTLVVAATTFLPWLQGMVRPDLSSEIRKEVNNTLTERLSVSGNVDDVEQLRRRVAQLEAEAEKAGSK
ncbi:dCTP deaminase [Plantactinospora sp. CA-290183]|uniref:dCTP deaminase n=1 Tax=Plantactinospora sp. CA-290183 TaxID=3240006 RepID=UPI003D8D8E21